MKKLCLCLAVCSVLVTPLIASADAYDGPYCFEATSTAPSSFPDPNDVRGTCKTIQIENIVTLDPALAKNYFIGTHNAIGYNCDGGGCGNATQYSEELSVLSSSSVITYPDQPDQAPIGVALFDKSFFFPLLTAQFKQQQMSFSGAAFPPITIDIYQQAEFNLIKNEYPDIYPFPRDTQMDVLQKSGAGDYIHYDLSTFSYQEYGKHIWAPVGNLAESQYADVYKNDKALTAKDLGISYQYEKGGATPTVSIIDPLSAITNYWMYTQKNGKLALEWQKTDYHLEGGAIKTVMSDNNTQAVDFVTKTSSSTVKTATSSGSPTPAQVPVSAPAGKNIFQKIWDLIVSWFK